MHIREGLCVVSEFMLFHTDVLLPVYYSKFIGQMAYVVRFNGFINFFIFLCLNVNFGGDRWYQSY